MCSLAAPPWFVLEGRGSAATLLVHTWEPPWELDGPLAGGLSTTVPQASSSSSISSSPPPIILSSQMELSKKNNKVKVCLTNCYTDVKALNYIC